jgi:hypothetical protein
MELPPQRAKTGPAGDPGLAARRRWVEENPLKPKPGLTGPPVVKDYPVPIGALQTGHIRNLVFTRVV